MSNPMPAWYPDPSTPGQQRYWDGTQWTEHVAPMVPSAYAPPPNPYTTYAQPQMYTYAHWGLRVGGYLLDALFFAPLYVIAALVLNSSTTTTANIDGTTSSNVSTSGLTTALILYVIAFAFVIWNQIIRQGRTGYSLGKQIVGIRLIKEATAQPLGGWLTLGRSLLHILDGLPLYLGYLWPLWDAKKQTFADKIVKSVVVVEARPKAGL